MFEDPLRRGVAEFVGTFTLIFIGAGSIVTAKAIGDPSLIGVAIAHGVAIAVMVSALGHISGGHFNPAITFGFLITRRIKPALGVVYWLAQLGGGALGALLVRDLLPRAAGNAVHLGVPELGHGVDSGAGFVLEAIFTFFLVWVVFATAVDPRGTFKSIASLAPASPHRRIGSAHRRERLSGPARPDRIQPRGSLSGPAAGAAR